MSHEHSAFDEHVSRIVFCTLSVAEASLLLKLRISIDRLSSKFACS